MKTFTSIAILAAIVVGRVPSAEAQAVPFEDPPSLLQPRTARSETAEDRAHAAALYAHGRLLVQRDRPEQALRRFQRAWRYDSEATFMLPEMIALAMELERGGEALRYAALGAPHDRADPALSLRLATLASDQRDWRRAALLFGQTARLQRQAGELDFTGILLHLELGRLNFLLGKSVESAEAFDVVREALDNPAKFGLSEPLKKLILDKPEQTYSLLAESYFDAKRLDVAATMFRQLNDVKKNEALHAFHLARIDVAREQWESALKRLHEYFDANGTDAGADPYELLQRCLTRQVNDADKVHAVVIERLASFHKRFPENIPLATFMADRYRRDGRFNEALALYGKLARPDADADVYGGWIETLCHQADDAALLAALARAAVALPSLDPIEESVQLLTQDIPRVTRLAKLAESAASAKPEPPDRRGSCFAMAQVAARAKQFDLAESLYELAASQEQPGREVVLPLWGMGMLIDDQPARAARVLRRLIDDRIRPESTRTYYYYLIGALEFSGQTDAALAAGQEARERDQASALLDGRIAWVSYHAKRNAEAERAYRQLLKDYDEQHDSASTREAVREARLVLSHLAVLQQDFPAAEEWLEQVLDEHPEDISAMNDLAYLWAERSRRLERALAMSRRVVAAEPKNPAYRDTLGWVLFRSEQFEAAVAELEQATAGANPDGVILDHWGDCLQKLNRDRDAGAAWTRAVEAFRREGDHFRREATERKILTLK